jgi:HK97 family phage major capsid protein
MADSSRSVSLDYVRQAIALMDTSTEAKLQKALDAVTKGVKVVDENGEEIEIDATLVVNTGVKPDHDDDKADDDDREDEMEKRLTAALEGALKAHTAATTKAINAIRVTGGETRNDDTKRFGFSHLGEFALDVMKAANNELDAKRVERLKSIAAKGSNAPSSIHSGLVGADGGFLIAPDFRAELLRNSLSQSALLPLTRQFNTTSNAVTLPSDEETPWSAAGVNAYWTSEATAITQSKANLNEVNVRLHKLGVLANVPNELVDDSALALGDYLNTVVPEKIQYKIDDAIINGGGTDRPLGIRETGVLKTVFRKATTAISVEDVGALFSAIPSTAMNNGVWFANTTINTWLIQMKVGDTPVFQPDIKTGMGGTLLGRPIVFNEVAANALAAGDLSFYDFSQYLTVIKGEGIRGDMSIHLYFDRDVSAFRFVFRIGGQPWMRSAITRQSGSITMSPFVSLAATTS